MKAFVSCVQRNLLLNIIKHDFGDMAGNIALEILRSQQLKFVDIVEKMRHSSPSATLHETKCILLKLLQHNLLDVEVSSCDLNIMMYSINVCETLYRLRFPRFIEQAKDVFGLEGEVIMEELLVHGRIRLDQSISSMAYTLLHHQTNDNYDVENPSHVDESKERINKIFVEMTKQRYITRVHPLDLNLKKTEGTDLQTSTSKPTRIMPSDDAKEISDDGITIRTIPSKRKLNLSSSTVPVELQLMIDAEEEKNRDDTDEAEVKYGDSISRSRQSKKRKLSKRAQLPLRGEKKLSSAQTSDHESSVIEERSLVWRYGSEQLICDLRHRACVRFASENINSVASQIVFSMLRYSSPHERGRAEITSFPVNARDLYSMHDVKEALPKDSKDSWRLLLNYITVMCRDKSAMVMKVAAESFDATQSRPCDGGQYVVHMKNIIDFLKQSTYHSFIRERFGAETARIVRLLAEKRQLEQKTIAELALLPSHEARRRLYELLTHGLVKMQEIPKRSDHNPAFTLYCWSVNAEGIEKMITERIFHSLCKLRRRRKFEADENKELIARSDQLVESNDLGKFEKLSRALDRLDRAMIQLDDMLMLFCDF